jgi:hypothetical protein
VKYRGHIAEKNITKSCDPIYFVWTFLLFCFLFYYSVVVYPECTGIHRKGRWYSDAQTKEKEI